MANETKHTPGPWRINEHTSGPAFDDTRVYIDSGMVQVAIAEHRADSTEKWANARLIAAAPELLEALKDLVAWANISDESHSRPIRDAALAAIAKAEGR